ncbi:MAG: hypothetical protein KatS3mg126_0088 [Lysobacteraceae bacterium]|nr:MAG: hypothetical protein KatS3mg126_0088 [Xanthomonadaceae bacterium]
MPRALMVHGAGGGGWEWNRWRAVFEARGWEVVAPDLSAREEGLEATTLEDYLAQLQRLCARQSFDALVGASLGGLLCLALAVPGDARPQVLVNPLPPAPEAARLPARAPYPERVAWQGEGRFAGTVEAMAGCAAGDRLYAFRHWRDESGAVLNAARAGVHIAHPPRHLLVFASEADEDVPVELSAALAHRLGASLLRLPGRHLTPLLGMAAHEVARQAVDWLNAKSRFTGN